uniref:Cytochrome c biogenesis protein CcmG, thiol:disulfide interchange protein DsbE n=1 Tax=Candidatus Kentrum sp. LFY TaxID=2126342 RepID=A0A450UW61_9GAMM|nr:MAG: cytochrome c biogenesis protein CcmG, thiol:disulfide interchange protein DsbE [Candidatus Kentron sp. LFY]VFK00761.1 MAG: cytochrome c biogenesis protein CcmG, thiol:disulfide interchange protein DsbE [Candidatus Kentron sp. LFY]VFK23304.1 MAG: cytochrome c biogenesis protein CcmG, thiol:disulfide interchange protein DsbE [Candidatus Kentron sp. LFY]
MNDKMKNIFTPLLVPAVFIALIALLWAGLGRDPRLVPSPLIGKPLPAFELPRVRDPEAILRSTDFLGKVSLLNVWATWCVSCRREHGFLMALAESGEVPVFGLNYKDDRASAVAWLDRVGDPYVASVYDPEGRMGLDLGVYGTPETFIIDAEGIIRYKRVGPITKSVWRDGMLPVIRDLKQER